MSMVTEYRALMNEYLPRPIITEADYQRAIKQVEKLMVPLPSRARSMMIEMLATLVEQYESKHYAATIGAPHEMLAHCIEVREVTASQVAKDTGIPQATLSNVLSGRRGISKANALKFGRYFNLPFATFIEGGELR